MAWRVGDGPKPAAWPARVLGAATTPRRRPPPAASGDRSASRTRSIFDAIGRAAAGRNAGCMMVWSQVHATWRARELGRELWRPREWCVAIGRAPLDREKELRACMSPRHECMVLSARVWCLYVGCEWVQVKPRLGQSSPCMLPTCA